MLVILKQGWELYRQNFGIVSAIVISVWLPLELLSSYLDYFVFGEDNWRKSIKFALFLENFFGIITTAAVISVGYTSLTEGPPEFGIALGRGVACWGRMWWTRFLTGLALIGGLLLLIIPCIYLLVRLALVEPVVVCERLSGSTAMRRSFGLTKGRFWQVFRLSIVLLVLCLIMLAVVFLPSALIPALDHWLVDAFTALLGDVLAEFFTLCFLCVYMKFSTEEKLSSAAAVLPNTEQGL